MAQDAFEKVFADAAKSAPVTPSDPMEAVFAQAATQQATQQIPGSRLALRAARLPQALEGANQTAARGIATGVDTLSRILNYPAEQATQQLLTGAPQEPHYDISKVPGVKKIAKLVGGSANPILNPYTLGVLAEASPLASKLLNLGFAAQGAQGAVQATQKGQWLDAALNAAMVPGGVKALGPEAAQAPSEKIDLTPQVQTWKAKQAQAKLASAVRQGVAAARALPPEVQPFQELKPEAVSAPPSLEEALARARVRRNQRVFQQSSPSPSLEPSNLSDAFAAARTQQLNRQRQQAAESVSRKAQALANFQTKLDTKTVNKSLDKTPPAPLTSPTTKPLEEGTVEPTGQQTGPVVDNSQAQKEEALAKFEQNVTNWRKARQRMALHESAAAKGGGRGRISADKLPGAQKGLAALGAQTRKSFNDYIKLLTPEEAQAKYADLSHKADALHFTSNYLQRTFEEEPKAQALEAQLRGKSTPEGLEAERQASQLNPQILGLQEDLKTLAGKRSTLSPEAYAYQRKSLEGRLNTLQDQRNTLLTQAKTARDRIPKEGRKFAMDALGMGYVEEYRPTKFMSPKGFFYKAWPKEKIEAQFKNNPEKLQRALADRESADNANQFFIQQIEGETDPVRRAQLEAALPKKLDRYKLSKGLYATKKLVLQPMKDASGRLVGLQPAGRYARWTMDVANHIWGIGKGKAANLNHLPSDAERQAKISELQEQGDLAQAMSERIAKAHKLNAQPRGRTVKAEAIAPDLAKIPEATAETAPAEAAPNATAPASTPTEPSKGVILGSGLGGLQNLFEGKESPKRLTTPGWDSYQATRKAAEPKAPTLHDKLLASWDWTKEQWHGYMYPLLEAEKRAGRPTGEASPSRVAQLARTQAQGASAEVEYNMLDLQHRAQKEGLLDALREHLDLQGFTQAHKMAEEKGLIPATVLPPGWTPEKIASEQQALKDRLGPEQAKKVQAFADEFNNRYQKTALNLLRGTRISEADYQKYKARGAHIPLNRIFEGVRSRLGYPTSLNKPTQKTNIPFEGSLKPTQDPFKAALDNMKAAIWEERADHATQTLVDFAQGHPEAGIDIQPARGRVPFGYAKVTHFEDGKPKSFYIPKEYESILKFSNPQEISIFGQAMRGWRNAWRNAVTAYNIGFAVPFTLGHYLTMATFSPARASLNPISQGHLLGEWFHSLSDVLGKNEDYWKLVRSGAAFGDLVHTLQEGMNNTNKSSLLWKPLRGVAQITAKIEEATKLTSLRRLEAQGVNPTDAAWQTMHFGGSPNYSYGGRDSLGWLNLTFPFWNAHLRYLHQGWDLFVNNPKGNLQMEFNPKFLGKFLGTLALMELGTAAWNHQFKEDDGRPALEHIPELDRQNNVIVVLPQREQMASGESLHRHLKIPLPAPMRAVHAATESLVNYFLTPPADRSVQRSLFEGLGELAPIHLAINRGNTLGTLGRSVTGSLLPPAGAAIDLARGVESYTGNTIEPRGKSEEEPQSRANTSTSPTLKALAHTLPGVPLVNRPAMMEYAIRRAAGTVPMEALNLADSFQRGPHAPQGEIGRLSHTPLGGAIVRRFVGPSGTDQVVQNEEDKFYTRLETLSQRVRTLEDLRHNKPQEWLSRMQQPQYQKALELQGLGNKARQELSRLRGLSQQVATSPKLSDNLKRQALHLLFTQRMQILQRANKLLDLGLQQKKAVKTQTPPPTNSEL